METVWGRASHSAGCSSQSHHFERWQDHSVWLDLIDHLLWSTITFLWKFSGKLLSQLNKFGRVGALPPDTWPMRGLKSYLQVRSSASPSATFSSWSWSVIITMRNSNEQCQGLGSMHLGLSLSLLFLSQTEDTRTRFWILSTSFSKYVDCQKIWQISIWPLRPRPLRLFESDRTESRPCQGNDKLKTQVLVNIFSRISSSISSFSGWARAIWMRWREPLLMRWLPTLWTGWRFCLYFIYILT